ncbi:NAD+ synthase [Candidatus Saganbacteria bacterium]|nr:NAD+ synthase [Candidatus Saganbacteria bacterium]
MKIALAQINPIVGDIQGNTKKITDFINEAIVQDADLVVFPELAIVGYPPEDLLLKPQFITDNLEALKEIAASCGNLACYVGFVDKKNDQIFNAGAFIVDKKIKEIYHKNNLPNYSVFDEKRYFTEGGKSSVISFRGYKIGLSICEDIWVERGPYYDEAKKGAKIILNINASPYHRGKIKEREKLLRSRAKAIKAYTIYVNMVGGQDEFVFDGGSMVVSPEGEAVAAAKQFKEELFIFDLGGKKQKNTWLGDHDEVYEALLLNLRDYARKNKFSDVIIGVSGGIDSALTLTLAVDALGKDKVHAVYMPSPYSARQSLEDSQTLCANLGLELKVIPISGIFSTYLKELDLHFEGKPANIAEENLQARIRGNILMGLSNKFGYLVLTTGNKSEMSTGYCTLYGDMAGGYSMLKDLPKTLVYKLVDFRNKKSEAIPNSIIVRPPTAELKPNQTDQDTLPDYDILDPIMQAYVEENKSIKQIAAKGFDSAVVKKIIAMIDNSEYKRRQSPPGPKITPRAFGKDWRLPITNGYKS